MPSKAEKVASLAKKANLKQLLMNTKPHFKSFTNTFITPMKNLNDIKELDKKELNAIQGGKGRIAGKKGEPEDLVDLDNQETPT